MGVSQGMNHALMRDASERPGEDDDVEGVVGVSKSLSAPYVVVDELLKAGGEIAAGESNSGGIGIERLNALRTKRTEPQGEASVAAADFQYARATPRSGVPEGFELSLGGINDQRHTDVPFGSAILNLIRSAMARGTP